MNSLPVLAVFAGLGGGLLLGYLFSRWMTWRFFKNKPPFKGVTGVMENGVQRFTSEGKEGPRVLTAVIIYVLFLIFLTYVAFNDLPPFLKWLG